MMHAADILGAAGPLVRALPGFTPRPQQQAMAEAIEQALEQRSVLLAEAGTGTGKTLAYLVPALLSGLKVLISTGSKNLQDQLFLRDLPALSQALELPLTTALLKGRANYLCRQRLERQQQQGRFASPEQARQFQHIVDWARHTQTGDRAELAAVAEDAAIWPRVTSTSDNCLGSDCPHFDRCAVTEARRRAQAADVVVVNHHLFFADLALREEGVAELLPAADAVIFDEAHQLPEVATHFFGLHLSGRQLEELGQDSLAAAAEEAADQLRELDTLTTSLRRASTDLHQALSSLPARGNWQHIARSEDARQAIEQLESALGGLEQALDALACRGKSLQHLHQRATELLQRLRRVQNPETDFIHWYETRPRNFALRMSPISVAENFRQGIASGQAWIFTSATLTVNGDFGYFSQRLGLEDAETRRWQSPFDYARNSLLYVPRGMPMPSAPDYIDAVVERAVPVLKASRGRAFFLFTSHRALQEAAARLAPRLTYPLLLQGSQSKRSLLQRFRDEEHAVLLATASFWEGVDVKGEALSCVIIDKLPFASPGDPVLAARLDQLRAQGGDPFHDYQLPQAVIALEQGVGRLIRDEQDRGVLMICDPRLLRRNYGRLFMHSLPPMPLTRDPAAVRAFFQPTREAVDG